MYALIPFLPRFLVLALAAWLSLGGAIWLPIVLVLLVVWGRGFPRVY